MPDWIYHLSDDQITIVVIAAVICSNVVAALVARFAFRVRLHPPHVGPFLDAYRMVVTLTALVLAFSLVQAQTNLRETQANLQREAGAVNAIWNALEPLDSSDATELRDRLRVYVHRIIDHEWPLLARGDYDRHADAILSDMLHKARRAAQATPADGQTYSSVIQDLDTLYDTSNARRSSASLRLAPSFWHAIFLLVLVSVLMAAGLPCTPAYMFSTALMSTALAVLIALTIIVDVPFQGESAVRPTELLKALHHMEG